MARDVLDVAQTVNSTEAEIHVVIDGRSRRAKEVASFDFDETLETEDFNAMGRTQSQKRLMGITTTGTITVNTGSPMINQCFEQFKRDGTYPQISVKTIQEDPTSKRGRRVIYYDDFKFLENKQSGGDSAGGIRTETVSVSFTAGRTTEDFKEA